MIAASLPSLNTRILLLERRYFGVDSETYNPLGRLVSSDAPEELEPGRIVLGFDGQIRTLVVIYGLVLDEVELATLAPLGQFANSLGPRADHACLHPRVKFVVVPVIEAGVPPQLRQRSFDLRLHLQLAKHVQAEVIASYRYFVAG